MTNMKLVEGTMEGKDANISIVASRFNDLIVNHLIEGAKDCLTRHRVSRISIYRCPGTFEIPLVIKKLLVSTSKPDGIVAVGALIRGETIHFDLIAKDVSTSIQKLALDYLTPIGLGILATENTTQAIERAGVKSGNKGTEAALAVIEMIQLMKMI